MANQVTLEIQLKAETLAWLKEKAQDTGLTISEVVETIIKSFQDEHRDDK